MSIFSLMTALQPHSAFMRRRLIAITGIIIIIAACLLTASHVNHQSNNERRYAGRKLSYWVLALGRAKGDDYQEALDTIERIDSNAVPYLIRWIQYERPAWRANAEVTIGEIPPGRVFIPIAQFIARTDRGLLADGALAAISILGTNEAPLAIAALVQIIRSHPGAQTVRRAMAALSFMGRKALPGVIETLRDPNNPLRQAAIEIICSQLEDHSQPLPLNISNAIAELAPEVFTNNAILRDIAH